MLRDEIAQYTELSGNDGLHTPIGIIGAYLDGYEKGRADVQQWIPVTERLPEIGEKVLVSTKYTVFTQVFKRIYGTPDRWGWEHNTIKKVTAWMPLPTPWKGEADE